MSKKSVARGRKDMKAEPGKTVLPWLQSTIKDVCQKNDSPAGTSIQVTLEELQPYDNNPRTTCNPLYQEIKQSIRVRGLDAPPQITRRPGEKMYVIRNGGNTRLKILKELWQETGDYRFFRIYCLYFPWVSEASMLIGHLAENELRGSLSFIEKAIGISKLKAMYEKELPSGQSLSLRKLSDRLRADGLPISFSLLGKMLAAVELLLPSIPKTLYAGLGRPQIERLLNIHSVLEMVYHRRLPTNADIPSFKHLWFLVLEGIENHPPKRGFSVELILDQMLGEMAIHLRTGYRMLELDMLEIGRDRKPVDPNIPYLSMVQQMFYPTEEDDARNRLLNSVFREGVGLNAGLPEILKSEDGDEQCQSIINQLRKRLLRCARQFERWCEKGSCITQENTGLGFSVNNLNLSNPKEHTVFILLNEILQFESVTSCEGRTVSTRFLGHILFGDANRHSSTSSLVCERIPDKLLITWFRMIQFARRFVTLRTRRHHE